MLRQRDAIAAYLKDRLRLSLHSGKEQLGKTCQGVTYLGYRVYPHHLHTGQRSVKALKARLDFFKHLFWPERFPLCQMSLRGVWQGLVENGELTPIAPSWSLLKRMEATINSYYGLMGHAESFKIRKTLYHHCFAGTASVPVQYPLAGRRGGITPCRRFPAPSRRGC